MHNWWHGMKFKKKENNRVSWGWNLVCTVTKCHEIGMKLHWEHLSFINTHSSIPIGHMVYLIINTNQQLNVIVYLWNCVMKLCIEGDDFILVSSWHGTLGNYVMKLCTEIGQEASLGSGCIACAWYATWAVQFMYARLQSSPAIERQEGEWTMHPDPKGANFITCLVCLSIYKI